MPIYARLGIPELWQYDGLTVQYYLLKDHEYEAVQISPIFPNLPAPVVDMYLNRRLSIGESQAIRKFKAWIANTEH